MPIRGHCLCKSICFELTGPHNWVGHCHCDSCRRGAGAPVVTFIGHPNGHWRWTGARPTQFTSSAGNYRYFCPTCGSSVAYASDRYPDEMHFHAALLETPAAVKPSEIYHEDERLPWHLDATA
ncbi:GFA family protein [Roseovarius aestuarii]|uniref:Glutathione-dependent formaldehyde-activating enzyme n=1 Tax=Roseovarius aestuarii TaxID=475083 RepID=A0A1X7BMP1_9RHOB|nr:GFA family protein [Roseovarius aestuarii]SMC10780.1 Glutathione-dependent formaldehyde-activating enzyme [Roseovarius aestuarii]